MIAWKEVTLRFTDPVVLLLTIALPLAIMALIDLAFGDLVLGRGIPDSSIAVGIVNEDRGAQWGNLGEIFERAMVSTPQGSVFPGTLPLDLFSVRKVEDEAQARHMVEQEKLIAALFIPPDFSESLAAENAAIEMYFNNRDQFRAAAFKSLVETLANLISTGEATVRATVEELTRNPATRAQLNSGLLNEAIADLAFTAARPESNPIRIQRVDRIGHSNRIRLTHYLAAALAIMFTGFTALMASASLLQEKTQWTLQRMHITPTRPTIILGGKTLGAYLNGLVQMGVLIGGMSAMEWASSSGASQAPKIDLLGLSALVLAVVAAATGIGVAIAGLTGAYAEAANHGRALLLLMALAGGIFFPVELFPKPLEVLSGITFHYWAMNAYLKLAVGDSATSVFPHVLVLGIMGTLSFTIGNWFLRRRVEFF